MAGCSTCGGGKVAWSWSRDGRFDAPSPAAVYNADLTEWQEVQYVGKRAGSMTYTVNGNRYQFGNNALNRVQKVRKTDVADLLTKYRDEFKIFEQVVSQPAVQPVSVSAAIEEPAQSAPAMSSEEPAQEQPAPEAIAEESTPQTVQFDLKGLSARRKNALASAGIFTLEQFVMKTETELARILSVTTEVATGFLTEAVSQLGGLGQ